MERTNKLVADGHDERTSSEIYGHRAIAARKASTREPEAGVEPAT
jgi:hypothetical protein